MENDPIKKNHILSQMREETYIKNWISIYQELDFMEPKIQKMFLQDGTNAMHDQRTRNR